MQKANIPTTEITAVKLKIWWSIFIKVTNESHSLFFNRPVWLCLQSIPSLLWILL